MLRVLALSPVLVASIAHAQAPGALDERSESGGRGPAGSAGGEGGRPLSIDPQPAGVPVAVVPIAVAPAAIMPATIAPATIAPVVVCGHPETVMDDRWAIGLSLGTMSLAPEGAPEDRTAFAIGELALRFRATRHVELELTVGGGRERSSDDEQGDLEVRAAMLAARFRFQPEAAWNWFVMAGLGGASVTVHDATDQERSDANRPMVMVGIGLERRFRHFALQAEARAIGIGDKRDRMDEPAAVEAAPTATMTTALPPADPKRSGGSLSIGVSLYF